MSPKERVKLSIRHIRPDKIPYHLSFTPEFRTKAENYFGNKNLDDLLGNHLAVFKARLPYQEVKPGFWRDEFGVIWNRTSDSSLGVVSDFQLKECSLKEYEFPDPDNPVLFQGIKEFIKNNQSRFLVVNIGHALFERAWSLRGMIPLMMDMVDNPKWVEELLKAITDYQERLIKSINQYDVDAVMFGDDWGQQNSLLFSKNMWINFIKPHLKRLYAAVKDSRKAVFHHSCGRVQELFPDLIEIGLDVFNPFQPDVMDIFDIKKKFGKKLTFYGGVSVQKLLPFGTPDVIKSHVNNLIEKIGTNGGFIIAPSHDIPGDVPLENFLAFVNAVKNQ